MAATSEAEHLKGLSGIDLGFGRKTRAVRLFLAITAVSLLLIWCIDKGWSSFSPSKYEAVRWPDNRFDFAPTAMVSVGWGIAVVVLLLARHRRTGLKAITPAATPAWVHAVEKRWVWAVPWRWIVLVLAAGPLLHFGPKATLQDGDILRLELIGSDALSSKLAPDAGQLREAIFYDYFFIACYVLLFGLLCLWAGCYYSIEFVRRQRRTFAAAALAAGLLDILENLTLKQVQFASNGDVSARDFFWSIANTAAWCKFALLLLAVMYVLGGIHSWLTTPRWVRYVAWSLPSDVGDAEGSVPTGRGGASTHGIALAGGGIRAASISLGALQVLDHQPGGGSGELGWDQAESVTAVSGGSNMAAGWSISRSTSDETPKPWSWSRVDQAPTPEEMHLIENLGYLISTRPRGDLTDPATSSSVSMESEGVRDTEHLEIEHPKPKHPYYPSAYATLAIGAAINILVLFLCLWVVARPIGWLMAGLHGGPLNEDRDHEFVFHNFATNNRLSTPGLVLLSVGVLLLFIWVLLGQVSRLRNESWLMGTLRNGFYAATGLGVGLLAILWAYPEIVGLVEKLVDGIDPSNFSIGAITGALGVLGAVVRTVRTPAARFAPLVGGTLFLVLVVVIAAYMTAEATEEPLHWGWPFGDENSGVLWLTAVVFLIALQVLVSPERWSLASFYRGKLRSAFATRREGSRAIPYENDNASKDPEDREPNLHQFRDNNGNPTTPLLVCATSTVSSRAVKTHYGIPALSVTFDPRNVVLQIPRDDMGTNGSYRATTRLMSHIGARQSKRVTTMLPVAISSAAVSPAMGRVRIGPARMLLAFANVRLGVWMPNPRYVAALEAQRSDLLCATASEFVGSATPAHVAVGLQTESPMQMPVGYPRTGLGYLFKELFGIHDLTDPFLYMTDGGHWENTGLVEMLRNTKISRSSA